MTVLQHSIFCLFVTQGLKSNRYIHRMAPFSEVLSMLRGQAFGKISLPNIDSSGQTVVVTGANTGLGLACAKHLCVASINPTTSRLTKSRARKRVSHIILACRDSTKGQSAVESILKETNCASHTRISVWPLDLSSYESVLNFASRVRTELPRLDASIANAGVELQTYREAEDLEIHLTAT